MQIEITSDLISGHTIKITPLGVTLPELIPILKIVLQSCTNKFQLDIVDIED